VNLRRYCACAVAINLAIGVVALGAVGGGSVPLPPPKGPVLSATAEISPVRIDIPAAKVAASVVPVGILPAGDMEMPDFGSAGWYRLGPRPGERGPAVIAAHFDSLDGPDVFYGLNRLKAGDSIFVSDTLGRRVEFIVADSTTVAKDQLPIERIWGPTDSAALTLITCGGSFDRRTRHYKSNVVVFARLAAPSGV